MQWRLTIKTRIVSVFRHLFGTGAMVAFWMIAALHVSPLIPWVNRLLTDRWEEPEGDVLIVLSAEQLSDGTIGLSSYWRTVYAVRAYKMGKCRRVVFSGGTMGKAGTPSLASEMGRFAITLGVPEQIITLEERSRSTHENALFTAAIVRDWPGTKVLMTSDYHMLRARRSFEHAGIAVRPAPIPDMSKRWNRWPSRWECIWTVSTEVAKLAYYGVRGWA